MKPIPILITACCAIVMAGCHHDEVAKGRIPGMLKLDNLTPEQQIAKVQADNSIPQRYKQLYINSVLQKEGKAPQGRQ